MYESHRCDVEWKKSVIKNSYILCVVTGNGHTVFATTRGNSLFIPPLNIGCCYDLLWPTECEGNDTVWLLSTELQRFAALTLLEHRCHVIKPRLPCGTCVAQLTVNKNHQTFIWALLDHETPNWVARWLQPYAWPKVEQTEELPSWA